MRSRQEIEDILSAAIESARQRHKEAGNRFRRITSEIPALLPTPDGALRIAQAGAEYRAELEALKKALARFNDYYARGIVPDDLADGDAHIAPETRL